MDNVWRLHLDPVYADAYHAQKSDWSFWVFPAAKIVAYLDQCSGSNCSTWITPYQNNENLVAPPEFNRYPRYMFLKIVTPRDPLPT